MREPGIESGSRGDPWLDWEQGLQLFCCFLGSQSLPTCSVGREDGLSYQIQRLNSLYATLKAPVPQTEPRPACYPSQVARPQQPQPPHISGRQRK